MSNLLRRLFHIPYELRSIRYGDWSDDRPVIVLLHGIGVNHRVWRNLLPLIGDQPVLSIDLLGFGASPKPDWVDYCLRDHAKALQKTLRRQASDRQLILCGHSLGTLIAIEYAKLFPKNIQELILCSPPIYRQDDVIRPAIREMIIKMAGEKFLNSVEKSPRIVSTANHYRVTQQHFMIDPENTTPYTKTARNSIMLQTSFEDVLALDPRLPITILYGTLDTVIVPMNLSEIAHKRPHTTIDTVLCGHEMRANYIRRIAKSLDRPSVV